MIPVNEVWTGDPYGIHVRRCAERLGGLISGLAVTANERITGGSPNIGCARKFDTLDKIEGVKNFSGHLTEPDQADTKRRHSQSPRGRLLFALFRRHRLAAVLQD